LTACQKYRLEEKSDPVSPGQPVNSLTPWLGVHSLNPLKAEAWDSGCETPADGFITPGSSSGKVDGVIREK